MYCLLTHSHHHHRRRRRRLVPRPVAPPPSNVGLAFEITIGLREAAGQNEDAHVQPRDRDEVIRGREELG